METTPYASRLRYLDADDVDDAVVDYDGLTVRGSDSQKIGDVNGFVIDADARRVYYVVVDSGGWFTSRRFLLPIGHASLGSDRQFLQTDLTRETISRLPEFDEDRFRRFTDDELRVFERDTVVACCPDEPLEDVSLTTWSYDTRRHYQQPAWWGPNQYAPERLRTLSRSVYSRTASPSPPAKTSLRDTHNQEVFVGREDREPGR